MHKACKLLPLYIRQNIKFRDSAYTKYKYGPRLSEIKLFRSYNNTAQTSAGTLKQIYIYILWKTIHDLGNIRPIQTQNKTILKKHQRRPYIYILQTTFHASLQITVINETTSLPQ